jgi:uncharacterized protein YraI
MLRRLNGLWLAGLVMLCLGGLALAQSGVRAVTLNDNTNIRLAPAFGADILATVPAGQFFDVVTARSPDGDWIRIDYLGNEGWVHTAPLSILAGDVRLLPVADPRTIPFGGFAAPRSGQSPQVGPVSGVTTHNVHLRAGPSTAYPSLAHLWHDTPISLTGRTAASNWYQANFEGLLGWVSATYVTVFGAQGVEGLPVDGIVATSPPISNDTRDAYITQLTFMRERVDAAQVSLDQIRGMWTDASIAGRTTCQSFPAQPSDMQIAQPLLAAFYPTLNPLLRDFNAAMVDIRLAINLYIEACNQPGSGNPIGVATVQGALEVVNRADSMLSSLRQRLNDLIPDFGEGRCVFTFNGQTETMPNISLGVVYREQFTARDFIKGYCLPVEAGRRLNIQAISLPGGNIVQYIAISPLADPTTFLKAGQSGIGGDITVSPIDIPYAGVYLMVYADQGQGLRDEPPQGETAFVVTDITSGNAPTLIYDAALGAVQYSFGTVTTTPVPGQVCPSLAFTCQQLFTCAEAQACLAAGNFSLDPDNNGIPCEPELCTPGS